MRLDGDHLGAGGILGLLFFLVRISAQAFLSADHPFGHFPYTKPESGSFSFVITRQEIHELATTTRQISDYSPDPPWKAYLLDHSPRTGPFGISKDSRIYCHGYMERSLVPGCPRFCSSGSIMLGNFHRPC